MGKKTRQSNTVNDRSKKRHRLHGVKGALVVCILLIVLFSAASAAFGLMLRNTAYRTRDDFKELLGSIARQDTAEAESVLPRLDEDVSKLDRQLGSLPGRLAAAVPDLRHEMEALRAITALLDHASGELLAPYVSLMKAHPLADIRTENGDLDPETVGAYVGFLEEKRPKLESMAGEMNALIDMPMGLIEERMPKLKSELTAAGELSLLVSEFTPSLLEPTVSFLQEHPLSSLLEDGEADLEQLGSYIDFLGEKSAEIVRLRERLETMQLEGLEDRMPELKSGLQAACRLLELMAENTETLLKPGAALLRDYPLSQLKGERGGFNLELINRYFDFLEEKGPALSALKEELETLDLGALDRFEKLGQWREKALSMLERYESAKRFLPVARAFLGSGEEKVYLLAAQNSSEIRASGGFPGAMSLIRVRNGELIVEEFNTVTNMLFFYGSAESGITQQEIELFSDWFYAPRDADFCPDFERVAEIWATGYWHQHWERVDGVISATPVIIQRLLGVVGELTLSDGSVLNGENATRVLEYDIYYRYMSVYDDIDRGEYITDALFAETAKTVLSNVLGNMQTKDLVKYLDIAEQSTADRTVMLWFADPAQQELVRAAGMDGGLDRDPARPRTGIYFSLNNPSRLGWFLDIDPEITELGRREDGSREYSVTVRFTNTISEDELARGSYYIVGSANRGVTTGLIHLFAPAGGTIKNVSADGGLVFRYDNYHGLALAYAKNLYLQPGQTVSMVYTVTTAPGEQADLGVSMTPTLSAYR